MINWVLRGAVLLWAVFFLILGVQGVLDPATYTDQFGIAVDGAAANTVRADMSAFFLVSAVAAALGALMPGCRGPLLVPAQLSGNALVGRLIGQASGDVATPANIQGIIVEDPWLPPMDGSWWVRARAAL